MIVNPATIQYWCSGCRADLISKGPQPTPATITSLNTSKGTVRRKRQKDKAEWALPTTTFEWTEKYTPWAPSSYYVSSRNLLSHDSERVPVEGKWETIVRGYHIWNVTTKDLSPTTFGRALSQALGQKTVSLDAPVSEDFYTGESGTLLEENDCRSFTMNPDPTAPRIEPVTQQVLPEEDQDHPMHLSGDFKPEDIRMLKPKKQIEAFFQHEVLQAYEKYPLSRAKLAEKIRAEWKRKKFHSPVSPIDGTRMDVQHVDRSVTQRLRNVTGRVLDQYPWLFDLARYSI